MLRSYECDEEIGGKYAIREMCDRHIQIDGKPQAENIDNSTDKRLYS